MAFLSWTRRADRSLVSHDGWIVKPVPRKRCAWEVYDPAGVHVGTYRTVDEGKVAAEFNSAIAHNKNLMDSQGKRI